MGKTELRQHGQHAAGFALSPLAEGGEFHVLNSGKAYNGEILLRGDIVIRENPNVAGELIMLGDHDRSRILGAWTGVSVNDGAVVADGYRWASPEVEPMVSRYRGLVDEKLLWGTSIGFTGRWFFAPELPDSDPDKDSGASWIIEGTPENPIEVYEASLVTIGADADSMITYQFAAAPEGVTQAAALEMEPEDERIVEGIAGSLMLQHLVNEHGMDAEAAEDAVRRMLAGEDPDVIEDEGGDDDGEMAASGEAGEGAFFDVPAEIRDAAREGLEESEEYGRAEGGPGAATARALSSGQVDAEKVIEMVVWWARWEDAEPPEEPESDGGPSATEIRWKQWGGNPAGARWARQNEDAAREEVGEEQAESEPADLAADPEPAPATFAEFLNAAPPAPDGDTFADFLRAVSS